MGSPSPTTENIPVGMEFGWCGGLAGVGEEETSISTPQIPSSNTDFD